MENLKLYFDEYAAAALRGSAEEVAGFYAQSFLVVSKEQSSTFRNDEKFIDWLNDVFAFNKQTGLQEMKVKHVEFTEIGKYFISAKVNWIASFEQKPGEEIEFDIHYILNRAESKFKITMYISEDDQEELMKERGLL